MADFKINMAAARINVGMTQAEVAAALGVDRTAYLRYERGESIMRMDIAYKFSEIVNIPMEHINFLIPKNAT